MKKETYTIHIAFKDPEQFENLIDNDLDIQESSVRNDCLVLTLWNDDEITIPMREVLFFIVQE